MTFLFGTISYFEGHRRTSAARLYSALIVYVYVERSTLFKYEVALVTLFQVVNSSKSRIISGNISFIIKEYVLIHRISSN